MTSRDAKSPLVLGFLTVVQHEQHGYFGGYLLLNALGRPLEFHCTTPLKPNRAQEILYGPTLEPFLYGEQIGATLAAKATAKVSCVCTDQAAALALRDHVALPVAWVLPPSPPGVAQADALASDSASYWRIDAPQAGARLITFSAGVNRLALPEPYAADQETIAGQLATLPAAFDLAEPFARIRSAIDEAQRAGR